MSALSEELKQQILAYLPRYPSKQAVTLPALHLVHDALRSVPLEAICEIAELLDLSPAEVHDTMSFYGFFRDEKNPLGRTRVWICRSLPCMLRGGDELLARLSEKLGVQPGHTTTDGPGRRQMPIQHLALGARSNTHEHAFRDQCTPLAAGRTERHVEAIRTRQRHESAIDLIHRCPTIG